MKTRRSSTSLSAIMAAAAGGVLFASGSAQAQVVPGQEEVTQVDEIVVTAQKRAENILDVPISISAFTEETLENKGLQSVGDLAVTTPNLVYDNTSSIDPNIRVRGISSAARNIGFESGLGLYVDGVFVGRSFAFNQSLEDIERVEVLRGPQGTLYGKNTTIGALNLITRRPGDEVEGAIFAEGGEDGYGRLAGYVAGPLVEGVLGAKISGFTATRDGLWENLNTTGRGFDEYRSSDEHGVRGELRWRPAGGIDIALRGDWSEYEEQLEFGEVERAFCAPAVPAAACLANALPPSQLGVTGQPRVVDYDRPALLNRELQGVSLTGEFEVWGGHSLTYIGAYRTTEARQADLDVDASPLDILWVDYVDELELTSHELRLTSPQDQRFTYILGAFLYDQTATTDRSTLFGQDTNRFLFGSLGLADAFAPAFPFATRTVGEIETESYAVFASGEFDITDQLTLTGGLRYTNEDKTLTASQDGGAIIGAILSLPTPFAAALLPGVLPAVAPLRDERSDSDVSPTIGLNWTPDEDTLVYGRFARGFKSGGWSLDFVSFGQTLQSNAGAANYNPLLAVRTADLADLDFEPEQLDTYEIGIKTRLLDRRLQLTAAAFFIDYSDIQVLQFVIGAGNGYIPANAEAESKGFEVEFVWRPSAEWTLDGGVGYADAEYTDYPNPIPGVANAAGQALVAPDVTANLGIQYDRRLGFMPAELIARLDWYHQGETPPAVGDPYSALPSFDVFNARLGIQADAGWEAYLFANNLFDSDHDVARSTSTRFEYINVRQELRNTADPRQLGVRLAYRF